ncbi:MAG: hypothetical protein GYA23_00580 [Methanomicrobiales archaeon]|nr:hypothetical protein [Methanomicrobiales archaeon]
MKVGFASLQVVEVSDLSDPGGREEPVRVLRTNNHNSIDFSKSILD